MSKVNTTAAFLHTAQKLNTTHMVNGSDHENMAKLHGVKEHLINFFSHGKIHAGKERMAGLMAVSTGLAAAMEEMNMTPFNVGSELRRRDVDINFAVGEEGGALAGNYCLRLSGHNGGVRFSLTLGEGEKSGKVATFSCSQDEMERGLGTLITVKLLQRVDREGLRLSHFIETGKIDLTSVSLKHADLKGADLRGADLQDANVSGTYFSGEYFSGDDFLDVDLRGANLSALDLSHVDLLSVRLSGAVMRYTDLRNAFLVNQNLSSADLLSADLRGANLQGAKLASAKLQDADLRCVDLSKVSKYGVDFSVAKLLVEDEE